MALTGCFLILFVAFHALMNGVAIFWPTAYNVICEMLGANWYALIGTAVLAGGFLLHIIYACWLTVQNRKARGNERYEVNSRPPQVEWSSKNMLVLGIVVLAFLAFHLIQFWTKMQFTEVVSGKAFYILPDGQAIPCAAGTYFFELAFSNGLVLAIYLVALAALWLHMTHGFWSMFQSAGWNGRTWMPRLRCIGNWFTTIFVGLFMAEAIVFTVMAHKHYYTTNEDLIEQYIEMGADLNGDTLMPATDIRDNACEGTCGDACEKACNGNCADCANPCGTCNAEGTPCACPDCPNCAEGTECTGCTAPCPGCKGSCKDITNTNE